MFSKDDIVQEEQSIMTFSHSEVKFENIDVNIFEKVAKEIFS